jgi:pimeloyl-ACP methyl ester carboxylesterase
MTGRLATERADLAPYIMTRRREEGGRRCSAATADAPTPAPSDSKPKPIRTLSYKNFKAYWLAPFNDTDATHAKGVVLFMHGFVQSPKAYYNVMKELADQGLLVLAPFTDFNIVPKTQQSNMISRAEFCLRLVRDGSLAESIGLGKDASANTALLAHSVGAGLSIYIAAKKADADGAPFKAVVALAPAMPEKPFTAEAALDGVDGGPPIWPATMPPTTKFLVQYGLLDWIAPPKPARSLISRLETERFAVSEFSYPGGTHVGFQDQVFFRDDDVNSDILPWLNSFIALLALGIPGLLLPLRRLLEWLDKMGMVKPPVSELESWLFNDDDDAINNELLSVGVEDVKLETDEQSLAIYGELLLVTTALTVTLGLATREAWERYPDSAIGYLLGALCAATGFISVVGAIELPLNAFYVNPEQRKRSKEESAKLICPALGVSYTEKKAAFADGRVNKSLCKCIYSILFQKNSGE